MGRRKLPRETRVCAAPICCITFDVLTNSNRKYCSPECYHSIPKSEESNKKRSKALKGKKLELTVEERKRRSESKKGDNNPAKRPEVREKIRNSRKEKSLSELGHKSNCNCCNCKAKRGETKGESHPFYGKTWEEIYGVEEANEKKKKHSESHLGLNTWSKGSKLGKQSDECIEKIDKLNLKFGPMWSIKKRS